MLTFGLLPLALQITYMAIALIFQTRNLHTVFTSSTYDRCACLFPLEIHGLIHQTPPSNFLASLARLTLASFHFNSFSRSLRFHSMSVGDVAHDDEHRNHNDDGAADDARDDDAN
jgi:hypothetical protein